MKYKSILSAALSVSLLLTAGCATLTGTSVTSASAALTTDNTALVNMIKTDYPTLVAGAQAYASAPGVPTAEVTAINNAIATANPLVANLSSTSPSSTLQAILTSMVSLISHQSGVSTQTKADIALALQAVNSALSVAGQLAPILALF